MASHQHVPGAGLYWWKDNEDKDSTWEPEHSVYCHGYVNAYWARYRLLATLLHLKQERQDERRKSLASSSKNGANEAEDQGALLPDLTPPLTSTIDSPDARSSGSSLASVAATRQSQLRLHNATSVTGKGAFLKMDADT